MNMFKGLLVSAALAAGATAADAPRSGPRTAQFGDNLRARLGAKRSWHGQVAGATRKMKLFNGLFISAALVAGTTAADAQVLPPYEIGGSPYAIVSDVEGAYAPPPGGPAR